jgi:hypothetical protein
MFKEALKENMDYIKVLSSAYKFPENDEVIGDIGTIMLINNEGWVLTCKHIAEIIVRADKITSIYEDVRKELLDNKIPPKKIYKKYNIKNTDVLILKNVFLNVLESWSSIKLIMHDSIDIALIKFEEPKNIFCKKFPVFSKENACVGESVCRIGYPYPDFLAFKYDYRSKDLVIKENMDANIQPFPIDGMVTRNILDTNGNPTMFEITNPGLRGQSGGPIINTSGTVVGLFVGTALKDLEIDVDAKLKRGIEEYEVKQANFLSLGLGINVEAIKEFLRKNDVKFKEK